jgi:hypothetical protein
MVTPDNVPSSLVPAKAGTQFFGQGLDSRFRGNERSVLLYRGIKL